MITVTLLTILTSCAYDKGEALTNPQPDCDGIAPTYSGIVRGLIESRCATDAACHGTGSINGPGPLTGYQQIKNASANIRSAVHTGLMPKGSTLTATEIKSITCWIDNGAINN